MADIEEQRALADSVFDDAPIVGYDVPLPNGCFKCIGCGKLLPRARNWNQCGECDTRSAEDYC